MTLSKRISILALLVAVTAAVALAQSPIKPCTNTPKPTWCSAVRGDRPSTGWLGQGRSEVMAQHGIVSTSQPLAAEAGLRVLMAGGNAIDAAIATASTLNLVEPMNVGIGGDLFAIIYIAKEHKLYQLNAGGMAPGVATVKYYNDLGYFYDPTNWGYGSGMPSYGILSAPIPSAAWGWDEAHRRFGKLSLLEDLTPAIEYAEHGFPISEVIGNGWRLPKGAGTCAPGVGCSDLDPDSVATWYINGQPPTPGTIFKNPDLAHTLRLFGERGREVFYKGEIAHAIVKKANALGGHWTLDDLEDYYGQWDTPAHTTFTNSSGSMFDIYETMAPSQAWNVVEYMNILEACVPKWLPPGQTLATLGPTNPLYWHLMVEAKKLSFIDLYNYGSDPRSWNPQMWQKFNTVTSKAYAATLCSKVNPNGPAFTPTPTYNGPVSWASSAAPNSTLTGLGDTIYLTTADRWGNMVSWINSNYSGFGSGITVPGYGFILNDRAAQFTLNPAHPNHIAPHKRPYDTISAGFVMQNGVPLMTLGLMGGDMQVQGHGQMLINILELGANVQASTDMARFYHNEVPNTLGLETQLYNLPVTGGTLGAVLHSQYGHNVSVVTGSTVGGYQSIMFTLDPTAPIPFFNDGHGHGRDADDKDLLELVAPVNGFYRAGSDHRKDGEAVGW